MAKTVYGFKKKGASQFVVVVPHGADDKKAALVAKKLRRQLNSFLVVNRIFIKPTHSRAQKEKSRVQDFNVIRWSKKYNRYLWRSYKHNPALKVFFDDISEFCDMAKEYSLRKKAVVLYIHSFSHEKLGIDIGIGLRVPDMKDKITLNLEEKNSQITAELEHVNKIRDHLQKKLMRDFGLKVGIGEVHTAEEKCMAIHFHKQERDDYALQLEINSVLRANKVNINYISTLLKDILKEIYI